MTSEQIALLSAVASALSAAFAAVATFFARRQMALADRAAEASVFLQIYEYWNTIYPAYRKLISEPKNVTHIVKSDVKFDAYASTSEWQEMRPIFAFYEFLGALIRTKTLKEHTLFSLVTVNTALWKTYAPLIEHFRINSSRPDLYTGWEYLVSRRRRYAPGKEHIPLPDGWFERLNRVGT
jgi:hypothetical protein